MIALLLFAAFIVALAAIRPVTTPRPHRRRRAVRPYNPRRSRFFGRSDD